MSELKWNVIEFMADGGRDADLRCALEVGRLCREALRAKNVGRTMIVVELGEIIQREADPKSVSGRLTDLGFSVREEPTSLWVGWDEATVKRWEQASC